MDETTAKHLKSISYELGVLRMLIGRLYADKFNQEIDPKKAFQLFSRDVERTLQDLQYPSLSPELEQQVAEKMRSDMRAMLDEIERLIDDKSFL